MEGRSGKTATPCLYHRACGFELDQCQPATRGESLRGDEVTAQLIAKAGEN